MAASTQTRKNFKSDPLIEKEAMEIKVGPLLSSEPSINLMQNCDLPPPVKLYTFSDNANRWIMSEIKGISGYDEKLDLMKALRSAQKRVREADRTIENLKKENDLLYKAVMQDSMRLFGYRLWVRLLEMQIGTVQMKRPNIGSVCSRYGKSSDGGSDPRLRGLVLFWGIAGLGLAFGCKYLL